MIWVDLAIAATASVIGIGIGIDVWGDLRRLLREVGSIRATSQQLVARSRR